MVTILYAKHLRGTASLGLFQAHQVGQGGVLAHDEADSGGSDQLLPVAVPDGRVLELPDSPERGQHVLHGHLEAHERVPGPHVLVQASDILQGEELRIELRLALGVVVQAYLLHDRNVKGSF